MDKRIQHLIDTLGGKHGLAIALSDNKKTREYIPDQIIWQGTSRITDAIRRECRLLIRDEKILLRVGDPHDFNGRTDIFPTYQFNRLGVIDFFHEKAMERCFSANLRRYVNAETPGQYDPTRISCSITCYRKGIFGVLVEHPNQPDICYMDAVKIMGGVRDIKCRTFSITTQRSLLPSSSIGKFHLNDKQSQKVLRMREDIRSVLDHDGALLIEWGFDKNGENLMHYQSHHFADKSEATFQLDSEDEVDVYNQPSFYRVFGTTKDINGIVLPIVDKSTRREVWIAGEALGDDYVFAPIYNTDSLSEDGQDDYPKCMKAFLPNCEEVGRSESVEHQNVRYDQIALKNEGFAIHDVGAHTQLPESPDPDGINHARFICDGKRYKILPSN